MLIRHFRWGTPKFFLSVERLDPVSELLYNPARPLPLFVSEHSMDLPPPTLQYPH